MNSTRAFSTRFVASLVAPLRARPLSNRFTRLRRNSSLSCVLISRLEFQMRGVLATPPGRRIGGFSQAARVKTCPRQSIRDAVEP